ncbi:MAG: hypothetical protein U0744_05430 [Gemmataceae bacterium]
MDQAVTALIKDLNAAALRGNADRPRRRVRRSPFREGRTAASQTLGRDHHPFCFTLMLAGGASRAASATARPSNSDSMSARTRRDLP